MAHLILSFDQLLQLYRLSITKWVGTAKPTGGHIFIESLQNQRCTSLDLSMNVSECECLIKYSMFTCLVLGLRFEFGVIVGKSDERVLFTKGIGVILKEEGFDYCQFHFTVWVTRLLICHD